VQNPFNRQPHQYGNHQSLPRQRHYVQESPPRLEAEDEMLDDPGSGEVPILASTEDNKKKGNRAKVILAGGHAVEPQQLDKYEGDASDDNTGDNGGNEEEMTNAPNDDEEQEVQTESAVAPMEAENIETERAPTISMRRTRGKAQHEKTTGEDAGSEGKRHGKSSPAEDAIQATDTELAASSSPADLENDIIAMAKHYASPVTEAAAKGCAQSELGKKRKVDSEDDANDKDYRTGGTDTEDDSDDESEQYQEGNDEDDVVEVSGSSSKKDRRDQSFPAGNSKKNLHPLLAKHGTPDTAIDCLPETADELDLIPGMYIRASILFEYVTALSNEIYEETLDSVLAIQTSQYWTLRCVCYGKPQSRVKKSKKCQCGWRVTMRVANIGETSNAKDKVEEGEQREAQMNVAVLRINSFLPNHTGHQPAPYGGAVVRRRYAPSGAAPVAKNAPLNKPQSAMKSSGPKIRKQKFLRRATLQRQGMAMLQN
jgi:hypothetical protein